MSFAPAQARPGGSAEQVLGDNLALVKGLAIEFLELFASHMAASQIPAQDDISDCVSPSIRYSHLWHDPPDGD